MTELIIIKTNQGEKVKHFLQQEHITYETYHEENKQKITEEELGKAYREAWSNPNRYKEAQLWEKATVSDWAKRTKKDKN